MKQKERFYILDLLRGLAVILMIAAHSVYFFHVRDNSFLLGLEYFGNTFCYTAFLLVSGAASYIAYLKEEDNLKLTKRIGKRITVLLLSYYALAFIVLLPEFASRVGFAKLSLFFDLIAFRNLPSYTEYLPPFIIYSLIIWLSPVFFQKIGRNLGKIIGWSAVFYLCGYLLNHLPVPDYFMPWKAFFSGADGFFRFPILQYFPVYLIGLYWGNRLLRLPGLLKKKKLIVQLLLGLMLLTGLIFILQHESGMALDTILLRWPPSPVFLGFSLLLSFTFALCIYKLNRFKSIPLLKDFLLLLGQNAFAIFWTHIFLLSLYQASGGGKVSALGIFLGLFLVLLVLSIALATFLPFNLRLFLTFIGNSEEDKEEELEEEPIFQLGEELAHDVKKETGIFKRFFFPSSDGTIRRRRLIKKRHILGGAIIGLLVVVFVYPSALEEYKSWLNNRQERYWADNNYGYRQNLELKNSDPFTNISAGETAALRFDHKSLVAANKSEPDGRDIALFYLNNGSYKKIDFALGSEWNSAETSILFKIPATLEGGKNDGNYYLYYGNPLASLSATNIKKADPPTEYRITPGKEESHPLSLKVSKRWNIIGSEFNPEIELTLETEAPLENQNVTYKVKNTELSGALTMVSDHLYSGVMNISSLPAGDYSVEATIGTDSGSYKSQVAGFFVSYPLYVAWTEDWEGYDVKDDYLSALKNISSEFDLPMTHFFNPRIYVTSTINPGRSEYLTSWVKNRLTQGDGFGMHLHMLYDLVQSAGVEVKKDPNWGDSGDGYGVPTTAYTEEELKQIIQKGLDLLSEHGFERPEIYRAGGWFADRNVLQVLEELGFKADSSGRTSYQFGRNKITGPWNLQIETKPYLPSRSDQNVSSLYNSFNLLEIPNNGADSYAFSDKEMIDRFRKNFQGKALLEANQITYLSHPHWFNQAEQERVRNLFKEVSAYKAKDDRGPVIYTTTNEIAQIWQSR